MSAILRIEWLRWRTSPGLLAASAALLGLCAWAWLASIDQYLERQASVAEMTISATRALAQPALARTALAVAALHILFAPLIWVRERRALGPILLMSHSPTRIVISKWLFLWLTALALIIVQLLMSLSLAGVTDLDVPAIAIAALGLGLFSATTAALALAVSTLTRSQFLAVALTAVSLLALWAPDAAAIARGADATLLTGIALSRRLSPLLNGEFTLGSAGYFVGLACMALGLARLGIDRDRGWRKWVVGCTAFFLSGIAMVAITQRFDLRADVTREGQRSLASSTIQMLRETPDLRVEVLGASAADRVTINDFFAPWQRVSPDLRLSYREPDMEAGEGVGVLVFAGDRQARLGQLSERDLVAVLARLARGADRVIGYVSGQGERDLRGMADRDLGEWGEALSDRGLTLLPIDLVVHPVLPDALDLLIVTGSPADLMPGTREPVRHYIEHGGALLWLADPGLDGESSALAETLGLDPLPGRVIDARANEWGLAAPDQMLINRFADHPALVDFRQPLLLAGALGWRLANDSEWIELFGSSQTSWNETGLLAGSVRPDQPEEQAGPHPLALAMARGDQRLAVIGDGDFLANRHVGNGGNIDLGHRVVDWLLGDDGAIPQSLSPAAHRIELGSLGTGILGLIWLIGLPGLIAAYGFASGVKRRA